MKCHILNISRGYDDDDDNVDYNDDDKQALVVDKDF